MAELSYNAQRAVRTLVGNWQEEQELKGLTGTARCKVSCSRIAQMQAGSAVVMLLPGLSIAQHSHTVSCLQLADAGAAGGYVTSSAVVEQTFDRVIKHTDCQVCHIQLQGG
jgi:hypothetical protein